MGAQYLPPIRHHPDLVNGRGRRPETTEPFSRLNIPKTDGLVIATAEDITAIRGKRNAYRRAGTVAVAADMDRMTFKLMVNLPGEGIKNPDPAVAGCGSDGWGRSECNTQCHVLTQIKLIHKAAIFKAEKP